jgi:hypothetical protein
MTKSLTWFRFYTEALDDPKVQRLPDHLFKTWVNLLCVAAGNDGKIPSVEDIAFKLRISCHEAETRINDLILAGLIDILPDHVREPHNWAKRQFKSDNSTERVKKHRAKQDETPGNVTQETECNVSETVTVTPPEQSRTETETEKTPLPPKGGPTPSDALIAFEAYNATASRCGLQQAAKLTPDRQRKIIARLRDYGMDGWQQALANVEKSSFLTGTNDNGWRANLDFMVQTTSFAKLHDGAYGNGRHSGKSTEPKQAWQMPTRAPERRQADKEAEWAQMAIDQGIA